jgi:hypothetical protein
MLNWVDFLVILATILVFGAVVAANNPHAKAQARSINSLITDLPQQASLSALPDAALIKAKIRLSAGGPWE